MTKWQRFKHFCKREFVLWYLRIDIDDPRPFERKEQQK